MAEPQYATREQCARATDVKSSAAVDAIIDRLIDAQSRLIDRRMNRHFYPLTETRTYTLNSSGSGTVGFWLERDILTVTGLTVDGVTVDLADVEVTPGEHGKPYSGIEFESPGGTEVAIAGTWGHSDDEAAAGALDAAITTTTATTCTVTDASLIGVGDLIHIDSERLVVTGRASATTGTTLSAGVDALTSATTIPVASGPAVHVGETILVDSERMLVIDIATNNLIVRRAVDGTVLAAHLSAATVYASRLLTVTRGAAGTTAAAHLISAAIVRNVPPGPINQLVIAETIAAMQQEGAGWAATAGTGESQRGITPEGLTKLREQAGHYRRTRIGRAV
jgi:hypothetical protein